MFAFVYFTLTTKITAKMEFSIALSCLMVAASPAKEDNFNAGMKRAIKLTEVHKSLRLNKEKQVGILIVFSGDSTDRFL